MADHKNFGQKGVGNDLQYGKRGGRLRHDSTSDDFFFRDDTDNFYLQVHGADPTEATHLTTKQYVDDEISGVAQHAQFYGVIVEESDGSNTQDPNDVIRFEATDFVVSADGDGKPLVTLEGDVLREGEVSEFYGIRARQTTGGVEFLGLETFTFNRADGFYLTQGSDGKEVIVNFAPDSSAFLIEADKLDVSETQSGGASFTNIDTLKFNDATGFYLSSDSSGQPVVNLVDFATQEELDAIEAKIGPAFYGLIVEESDGSNTQAPDDTLRFEAADFVVSADGDGKPLVTLEADVLREGEVSEFYGIFVGETGSGPVFDGLEGIKFNTGQFYVTQNDPNTDEAIVNLRGEFRDPLFRQAVIGTAASTDIGDPLPIHAVVKRVKLVVTERYDTPAAEIVVRSAALTADQIYMPADENDPRNNKEETFISESDPRQKEIDGTRQVVATISNTPGAGAATIIVEYLLP